MYSMGLCEILKDELISFALNSQFQHGNISLYASWKSSTRIPCHLLHVHFRNLIKLLSPCDRAYQLLCANVIIGDIHFP